MSDVPEGNPATESEGQQIPRSRDEVVTKFAVGQVVRHRTGGRRAVVTHVHVRCLKHGGIHWDITNTEDCRWISERLYDLSTDFASTLTEIDEILLEAMDESEDG